jgi:hypothetical protein
MRKEKEPTIASLPDAPVPVKDARRWAFGHLTGWRGSHPQPAHADEPTADGQKRASLWAAWLDNLFD